MILIKKLFFNFLILYADDNENQLIQTLRRRIEQYEENDSRLWQINQQQKTLIFNLIEQNKNLLMEVTAV